MLFSNCFLVIVGGVSYVDCGISVIGVTLFSVFFVDVPKLLWVRPHWHDSREIISSVYATVVFFLVLMSHFKIVVVIALNPRWFDVAVFLPCSNELNEMICELFFF